MTEPQEARFGKRSLLAYVLGAGGLGLTALLIKSGLTPQTPGNQTTSESPKYQVTAESSSNRNLLLNALRQSYGTNRFQATSAFTIRASGTEGTAESTFIALDASLMDDPDEKAIEDPNPPKSSIQMYLLEKDNRMTSLQRDVLHTAEGSTVSWYKSGWAHVGDARDWRVIETRDDVLRLTYLRVGEDRLNNPKSLLYRPPFGSGLTLAENEFIPVRFGRLPQDTRYLLGITSQWITEPI